MKGRIPEELIVPLLDALPVELTLTDAEDKIIAWSEPMTEIFHRTVEILGTDVYDCHPEKSRAAVEKLLRDFKSGNEDSVRTIIDCRGPDGGPVRVRIDYVALRSAEGEYLGCLEVCRYVDG